METNAKNFTMRMAVMEDAPEILAIYEPYIRKTTITFEYEVPTVEAFRQRMAGILGAYPYLVCEMDGKITAYAYAHRFKERAAYQWDAELSVYVDENWHGKSPVSGPDRNTEMPECKKCICPGNKPQ